MKAIRFDFNNMLVTKKDLMKYRRQWVRAHSHIQDILAKRENCLQLGLEWINLPFQKTSDISAIQKMGRSIAANYKYVVSLGIGGSYLGLKAAQDAMCGLYYNDFAAERHGRPRIYFEGNNLDPQTLGALLRNLEPRKTFVIVISKSGETTETKAAFEIMENWLKKNCGPNYGRQIFSITDPVSGTLRKKTNEAHGRDHESFRSLPVLNGVGGRFSELNIGLLHLAIIGVKIEEILSGARDMRARCLKSGIWENPSLMYAVLHTILYKDKGKSIAVMMPFSETLKSTADWYVQLLAESTGKKYARKIRRFPDGSERWADDRGRIVNSGRTPISARGTNDLHSIQQNNIEGEKDKVVTFIKVEEFKDDLKLAGTGDFLSGMRYSRLLAIAEEACEWALAKEKRPSATIILPKISPYYWGALIFFFEMATAYEGELLNINSFNQPGVEGYKNYMYYKLNRSGLPEEIKKDIRSRPLIKKKAFII